MKKAILRFAVASVATTSLAFAGVASADLANATGEHDSNNGNTRVAVAPRLVKVITAAGITASPTGPAKAFMFEGTLALRFPISNFAGHGNRVLHLGGVDLAAGSTDIKLSRFRVNLSKSIVSAKINGDSRAPLFDIVASHRAKLGAVRLTMNATAAGALNKTFGVHAFSKGQNFGFATVHAVQ